MQMDFGPLQASGAPSMICALVFTLAAGIFATTTRRRLWVLWIASVASVSIVGAVEMQRDEIPGANVLRFGATATALWVAIAITVTRLIGRRSESVRALRQWRVDLLGWIGGLIVALVQQIRDDAGLVPTNICSPGAFAAESLAGAIVLGTVCALILFGPPLLVMALGRVGLARGRRDLYHSAS